MSVGNANRVTGTGKRIEDSIGRAGKPSSFARCTAEGGSPHMSSLETEDVPAPQPFFFGARYVCVIRSCQQSESSSSKTQAYPIPKETAPR